MQNDQKTTANNSTFPEIQNIKPSASRTIRFSNFEWERIEREAKLRGMSVAGLVRFAAVGLANGEFPEEFRGNSVAFPPEIMAWTRAIFNCATFLQRSNKKK